MKNKKVFIIDDKPDGIETFIKRLIYYFLSLYDLDKKVNNPNPIEIIFLAVMNDSEDEKNYRIYFKNIDKTYELIRNKLKQINASLDNYVTLNNEIVNMSSDSNDEKIIIDKISERSHNGLNNIAILLDLILNDKKRQKLEEKKAILSHKIYAKLIKEVNNISIYTNYTDSDVSVKSEWKSIFSKEYSLLTLPDINSRSIIDGSDLCSRAFFENIFKDNTNG